MWLLHCVFAPAPVRNIGDVGNNKITVDMHIVCSHQPVLVNTLPCVFFRFEFAPRNDPIGTPSGTNFGPIWGSDPRSAAGMAPLKKASDNMMKITCCKPKMWLFPERQCDFQICNCPTWERFEAVIKPQIVKNQLVFVAFSEIDATSALCTP